ncbi:MAG TPA: hypothetical protein VMM78_11485 [Thermomicrobiales bacterium]|nr:hypothetical protein [Thermomicrobiales bacterium]
MLDNARPGHRPAPIASPLARFVLGVAPDLLRAVERSVVRRHDARAVATAPPSGAQRVYTSGMNFAEYDFDVRVPFVRHVTVRRATAWATNAPAIESPPPTSSRRRRAGILGLGGVLALTALGLLANRAAGSVATFARRA